MGVFLEKIFQPSTISVVHYLHKKNVSVLNTPLELLPICAKGSIVIFDWVLDTPLACLKKNKNCEKPVKKVIFRNVAAKTKK